MVGPNKAIESIQNRFLRTVSFRCNVIRQPHTSYQPLLSFLNLESLETRRIRLDLCFILKLLNGDIYCPNLLAKLTFNIPNRSTRQSNTFYVPFQSTNYSKNAPVNRCMLLVNKYNPDLFLCTTINAFNIYLNCLFS
jgi:hypothetical protein